MSRSVRLAAKVQLGKLDLQFAILQNLPASKYSRSGHKNLTQPKPELIFPIGTFHLICLVSPQKNTDREKMVVVSTPLQIGQLVRQRRKEAGLTLKDAAAMAGVGVRFLSELERGKSTLQLGLAIHILQLFGLELRIEQRGSNV